MTWHCNGAAYVLCCSGAPHRPAFFWRHQGRVPIPMLPVGFFPSVREAESVPNNMVVRLSPPMMVKSRLEGRVSSARPASGGGVWMNECASGGGRWMNECTAWAEWFRPGRECEARRYDAMRCDAIDSLRHQPHARRRQSPSSARASEQNRLRGCHTPSIFQLLVADASSYLT
jgi:hypothetical protein